MLRGLELAAWLVGPAPQRSMLAVAGAMLASLSVQAASIRALDVEHDGGCYRLASVTYIDAAPEAVFTVLTDYDAFIRVSSAYKESRFLKPHPDGTPVVYTRMKGCLFFFCKSISRVERLETQPSRFIRTTILPDQSDFTYGRSEWILEPEADGTLVTHQLAIEPDFSVPPLLGPWLLRKSLLKHGAAAVNRIEALAVELLPGRAPH
jgi:uncharacterized protein YndB with AHSA1/START domain